MSDRTSRAAASLAGRPWHALLVPIPFTCFILTFFTDLVYAQTADMMWADMSAWLLTVGLVISIFVVITGLIDFFWERRIRQHRSSWVHGIGSAIALILSIFNAFIHSRDAYTSVVPTGLVLSAIVAIIIVAVNWYGWTMVYREGMGVDAEERP
jgi:uncharacterized membrane protein